MLRVRVRGLEFACVQGLEFSSSAQQGTSKRQLGSLARILCMHVCINTYIHIDMNIYIYVDLYRYRYCFLVYGVVSRVDSPPPAPSPIAWSPGHQLRTLNSVNSHRMVSVQVAILVTVLVFKA